MSFMFCLSFIALFSAQLLNTTAEVHETLAAVADWVSNDLLEHGLRLVSDVVRQITAGATFHHETTALGILFFETVFRRLDRKESMLACSFRREVGRVALQNFMDSCNRDPAHVRTATAYLLALVNCGYISRSHIYSLIEGAADEIRSIYASQFEGGDLLHMPSLKMCRILGKPAFLIQQLVEDPDFFIRSILYEGEDGTGCSSRRGAGLSTRVISGTERLIASHWDSMEMQKYQWEDIAVPKAQEHEAFCVIHRRPSVAQSSQREPQAAYPVNRPLLNYRKDRIPFSVSRSAKPRYFREGSQTQNHTQSVYASFVPATGRPVRQSDVAFKSPEILSLWKFPLP